MTVDREAIERLHRMGLSAPSIAAQIGCSAETVRRWRKANGLSPEVTEHVGRPLTPERKEAARQLLDDGAPYEEVSRTLGITRVTLKRHFPGREWTRQEAGVLGAFVRYMNKIERNAA